MKKIVIFLLIILASCTSSKKSIHKNILELSLLQINDFYEIGGVDNGTIGGIARIASLKNKLKKENPNLLLVLAGDFLSPTLMGTLVHKGEKIKGRQMIECLNEAGLDLAAFGNHEFDYDQNTLQKRLNESKFDWITSNIFEIKHDRPSRFSIQRNGMMETVPTNKIYTFSNSSGKKFRIGFISPCIDANKVKYVQYEDIFTSTERELNLLQGKVDYIVALTHLNQEEDKEIAKRFPQINLILGGHEHYNMIHKVGNTVITKADYNAITAYHHTIRFDFATLNSTLKSELIKVNNSIPKDERIQSIVEKWKSIESQNLRNIGFDPQQVISGSTVNYHSNETSMRRQQTNFGNMVCKSMLATCPNCEAAIFNSGSSRLEDDIMGNISQYDILKAFPYAGHIVEFKIKGSALIKMLNAGLDNQGKGGYLQYFNIEKKLNWQINNEDISGQKMYTIITNEYLLTGQERGLDFINKLNPDLKDIIIPEADDNNNIRKDIRLVIIDFLKKGGR